MPIYGYACKSCDHTFDALQKMRHYIKTEAKAETKSETKTETKAETPKKADSKATST